MTDMRTFLLQRWQTGLRRRVLGVLFGLLLAGVAGRSLANVSCADVYETVPLPSLRIADDAPVGAVLWHADNLSWTTQCWKSNFAFYYEYAYVHVQNLTVPQYGLTFELTYKGVTTSTAQKIDTGVLVTSYGGTGGSDTAAGTYSLVLRKTGTTPSSGTGSGKKLIFLVADAGYTGNSTWWEANLANITFVSGTCTVSSTSRNITVPLGDIRIDSFKGVGSTSPDKKFNIDITCSKPAGTYDIRLRFSGTADTSGAPGVLALRPEAGAASGVGVQMLMDGAPVELGTDYSLGSAASTDNISKAMTARYYQIASVIKPGVANGIATFVVTYK